MRKAKDKKPEAPPGYHFKYLSAQSQNDSAAWVEISDGGLPHTVQLRIVRAPDGRLIASGLSITTDDGSEVSGETLRHIRIREILRTLYDTLHDETPLPPDDDFWRWTIREFLEEDAPVIAPQSREIDTDLRTFAVAYQRALAREPRRAMTAAAAEMNIHRATANRWARICRERGYLPPRPGQGGSK